MPGRQPIEPDCENTGRHTCNALETVPSNVLQYQKEEKAFAAQ